MSKLPYTPDEYSHCYGCGADNPVGLHMTFERVAGGALASRVSFGEEHAARGAVHSGFVTLALDEVAVQALLYEGVPNVSVELAVTQHAPLAPGEEIVVTARREGAKGPVVRMRVDARRVADQALIAEAKVACMRARVAAPGRFSGSA